MKYSSFLFLLYILSTPAFAQHEGHVMPVDKPLPDSGMTMTHAFSLNLPMNRNGSGTSWMPDATPMYAWMQHKQNWNFMLHGALFLRYTMQNLNNDYKRGGKQFSAPNWIMGMAQRKVGSHGLFLLRGMFSLDRLTVGGSGYPLLFQSGETWNNKPLVDRQHPHDLFSELAIGYTYMISKDIDVSAYVGYPGEPAIGPTAFMHRVSSLNNPDAPLGHHWQDATHVTFGVSTLGLRYKIFKVEGSSFTGREPEENRYNFDNPRFDSYSYRLSINPHKNVSVQASQGFIKTPEGAESENVKRTTASALVSKLIGEEKSITNSVVWGLNDSGGHHKEHSVLIESNYQTNQWALYGRYEWIQKSADELNLPQFEERLFTISTITIGMNYTLSKAFNSNIAVGTQVSTNVVEKDLQNIYGNNTFSAEAYIRIIPGLFRVNTHQNH